MQYKNTLKANEEYENAAKNIITKLQEDFPIGTIIEATLGGHRHRLRVVDNDPPWWYRPSQLRAVNLKTGTTRTVTPTSDFEEVEIIAFP